MVSTVCCVLRRVLPLLFLIAAGAGNTAVPELTDALVSRFGKDQLAYYEKLFSAKRQSPASPVKALVESALRGEMEEVPPMDIDTVLADPQLLGDVWLHYAEILYASEQFNMSEAALGRVPETYRRAHADRVELLQLRLALRTGGKPPASLRAESAQSNLALNQALALIKGSKKTAEVPDSKQAVLARQELIERLRRLVAKSSDAENASQRATLWLASLLYQAGQADAAQAALSSFPADSPLLVDALLVWLQVSEGLSPAAAGAIEQKISQAVPASPAAWEACAYLVERLLSQGAVTQAREFVLTGHESIREQIANIDQQLARMANAPLSELTQFIALLPEGHQQRVGSMLQSRSNLLANEGLLNGWLPYVHAYRSRIQRDDAQFSSDVRSFLRESVEIIRTGVGNDKEKAALLKFQLEDLVGKAPNDEAAYRLFRGLAKWELGHSYPENWTPNQAPTSLSTASEHAVQLIDLINTQHGGVSAVGDPLMALRLKQVYERNTAAVVEIRALIPQIEAAVRAEVIGGLKARRRLTQQWLNRYAFLALKVSSRQSSAVGSIRFPLGDELTFEKGSRISTVLASVVAGPTRKDAGKANFLPLLASLKGVIDAPEDQVGRVDALRLRAQLTVALFEPKVIASADDAADHYAELLEKYGDQIDRADVTYQLARAQELARRNSQSQATLADFARRFEMDPRSTEADLRLGEAAFASSDFSQARDSYESVLRKGESPFLDQALYKLGWTLFKLGDFREALPLFVDLVDRATQRQRAADRFQSDRVKDAFRALGLSFLALDGAAGVERYFAKAGKRPYVAEIYASLGRLYLDRERINDAALVYASMTREYLADARGPALLAGIISGARKAGLNRLALELKEQFSDRYAVQDAYWNQAEDEVRQQIAVSMKSYLPELAALYHADAQQRQNSDSSGKAIRYYRQYIDTFSGDKDVPRYTFMLAEAQFEANDLAAALQNYDRAAYEFGTHEKSAEASYAALITTQKLIDLERDPAIRKTRLRALVSRSSRFAGTFVGDARVDAVLVKAGEDILMLGEPGEAVVMGENLLARNPPDDVRRRARRLYAHGLFESGSFEKAEAAYRAALSSSGHSAAEQKTLVDRLGLSVYRQAEALRAAGNPGPAAEAFLRVAKVAPGSDMVPSAEIDAVAQLLVAARWREAIAAMERFMRDFPQHALAATVPTRLAFAYEKDGQLLKAAEMLEVVSTQENDPALARQTLLRAASLRNTAGQSVLAVGTYERYLGRFPEPLEQATEVRQTLADLAAADQPTRTRWLTEIIDTHARAVATTSLRVRFLAAQSSVVLGDLQSADFDAIKLKLPLDKALAEKRRPMERALQWYDKAGAYGVAEVTTSATYKTAEVYRRLANDMLASERPGGLTELERAQYKILLEEEASLFEEKAIKIHELNIDRIVTGIYDVWVKRSVNSLRDLLPSRYDRVEAAEAIFDYVLPKPVEKRVGDTAEKGKQGG